MLVFFLMIIKIRKLHQIGECISKLLNIARANCFSEVLSLQFFIELLHFLRFYVIISISSSCVHSLILFLEEQILNLEC